MKNYVLDACAAIRYLTNDIGAGKVDALIRKSHRGEVRLLISAVNWGEVLYILAGKVGLKTAIADLQTMSALVESVDVDETLAEAAAIVKLHYKLSYADCFAASLAVRMNATLVTSDSDFARLGKQLKLLSLPRDSM